MVSFPWLQLKENTGCAWKCWLHLSLQQMYIHQTRTDPFPLQSPHFVFIARLPIHHWRWSGGCISINFPSLHCSVAALEPYIKREQMRWGEQKQFLFLPSCQPSLFFIWYLLLINIVRNSAARARWIHSHTYTVCMHTTSDQSDYTVK